MWFVVFVLMNKMENGKKISLSRSKNNENFFFAVETTMKMMNKH